MDLAELKSDEESLLVLSALGFSMRDWSFINKVGANSLLSSKLIEPLVNKLAPSKITRAEIDHFLREGGFIISPLSHPTSRLFKCQEAPLAFLGRFNQELLNQTPIISVVGSRKASAYGLAMTRKLCSTLAKNGILVSSGGAIGIDQAAHGAAIGALGKTIAISGTACDLMHLDPCAKLLGRYPKQSLVLYPFGPFLPQGKFMFVERNRYVAAIADGLVVVEGQVGSGTLHTANYAKKLNIPLFAVPGAIDNPESFAPNHLLEEGGAKAVRDFSQFALSWVAKTANTSKNHKKVAHEGLVKPQGAGDLPELLRMIRDNEGSLGFDELLLLSGKSYADLQRALFDHELEGSIIKQGARFVLTGN